MSKKYATLILLTFCLSLIAHAKSVRVDYKGTFGIFGTVGTIYNTIDRNGTHYQIKSEVKLAGIAKILLRGQKEHYLSKGHLENGRMVSDYYVMTSVKQNKKVIKEYYIDHLKKKTYKRYRKWKHGKLVKEEKKDLGFYAKDDLLTLYFNMDKYVRKHTKGCAFTVRAVGLEKQKGIVKITIPSQKEESTYRKDLGKHTSWYAKALIVQENFRKKKGDILLAGTKDGFIKKAVIKDILMYGDAKLTRIK